MTTAGSLSSELRDLYTVESARIREDFAATGNGWAAISQRTALVEKIALHLWKEIVCSRGARSTEVRSCCSGRIRAQLAFSAL